MSFSPFFVVENNNQGSLLVKHSEASLNLRELEIRDCAILHEVDAHFMRHDLVLHGPFDPIIFNFPHAGFKDKESSITQIR